MANTFGHLFRITTWGDPTAAALGWSSMAARPGSRSPKPTSNRRRPGQSHLVTPRRESDTVQILSGVFEGQTLGTPICLWVRNEDARPEAYSEMATKFRPSHADYTCFAKYGIRNWQGGGRSSARETIGRVATLVGNPQNMIIGHLSHIPFLRFSKSLLPVAVVGLAIEYGVLWWGFRRELSAVAIQPGDFSGRPLDARLLKLALGGLALVFLGFIAGLNMAWTALGGAALVMVLAQRDTHEVLKLVDWHLLVFFAALFAVVEGLNATGLPDRIFAGVPGLWGASATAQAWNFAWFSVVGSNLFSNVPFVLVAGKWVDHFAQPELIWKVMALATTLAGNLTILGSVANMIVVESARGHVEVGFWDYAKFGLPVTLLTTVAGMVLLLLLG